MEARLDKEEKRRRFIFLWWLLPVLLVAGGGLYWFSANNSKGKIVSQQTTKTTTASTTKEHNETEPSINNQTPANTTNNTVPAHEQVKDNTTTNNNQPAIQQGDHNNAGKTIATETTVASKEKPVAKTQSLTIVNSKTTSNKSRSSNRTNTVTDNNKSTIAVAAKKQPGKQQASATMQINTAGVAKDNIAKAENITPVEDDQVNSNPVTKDNTQKAAQQDKVSPVVTVTDSAAKRTDTTATVKSQQPVTPTDSTQKATTSTPKKKDKKSILSRFEFSVLAEGDITTVKFKNVNDISSGIGIGVAFNITKRLSVATGFVVSKKLYVADSADYKDASYMGWYTSITDIDANCLVYDIPLNIQYAFSQKKNHSWIAAAGLSSYIMKRETYDYNYLYYGQPKVMTYEVKDQNQHWFSILNLAAAYRRQMGKNFAWQIMPFMKIPLSGIGQGKVALYTAGIQASLHFLPKR